MAIDERSRQEMYRRLEESLGAEAAATLMEHLPPVGWTDVATKRDLDQLRTEVLLRSDSLEHRLTAEFTRQINDQTRTLFFSMTALMITLASLTFAAVRLG